MSVEQFLVIFSEEGLCPVYEEYLLQNMAWENFGFYNEVQKFQTIENQELLEAEARKIYDRFIEVDSAHELGDITYQLREKIRQSLESPTREMFDELSQIVMDSLVNSTVTDFLRDPLFLNYVDSRFPIEEPEPQSGLFSSLFSCFSRVFV